MLWVMRGWDYGSNMRCGLGPGYDENDEEMQIDKQRECNNV